MESKASTGRIFSPVVGAVGRELAADGVVYRVEAGAYFYLNWSAFAIWSLCDGQRSVEVITEELASRSGMPKAQIATEVNRCLETFVQAGLASEVFP